MTPRLNASTTERIARDITNALKQTTLATATRWVARTHLGALPTGPTTANFCFWVPGVADGRPNPQNIVLELFTPEAAIDFESLGKGKTVPVSFSLTSVQPIRVGDFMVAAVDNIQVGHREQAGAFYWLRYTDGDESHIIRDPMVASAPFGVYAPAELFDVRGMLAGRRDMEYFYTWYRDIHPDGSIRSRDIGVHLEIHPETATESGSFAGLTQRYRTIGQKMQQNIDKGVEDIYAGLSTADLNFVAFDTIELTPEVPPSEREAIRLEAGEFFQPDPAEDGIIHVRLKHPNISNWGYDTPIVGSAAVNPSLLSTLRPNEFLEFVETLHTMPGRPIQLCIDSVLGHCDFQGARLLESFDRPVGVERSDDPRYIHSTWLRGPNMYGRDLDFSNPYVQAILLELLVRKLNYGFDCVRVDGAQDFILTMDEETGLRVHIDSFLNDMANVTIDINGLTRRPDMNLEDGRPWPDDLNWLYNSKYLDHTIERTLPFGDRVKQWSPIIFAHNVHGKYKWFMNKYNRFVEVWRWGANWITGHSNHDNVRYFYRLVKMKPSSWYRPGDNFDDYYNDQLGTTMTEVAHNAMDNEALTGLMLGLLPGNPMFMLNALFRTPWLFMRDIDDTYDVKIVAEEGSRFLSWYVDAELYAQADKFTRLKQLGFTRYRQLVAPPMEKESEPGFMDALFQRGSLIKTDALMVRHLFDEPGDAGGFADTTELRARHEVVCNSSETDDLAYRTVLLQRIQVDPAESHRRVAAARKLMRKNRRFLERDAIHGHPDLRVSLESQIAKIDYLSLVSDNDLALLLEDADLQTEYRPDTWATDAKLSQLAPSEMLGNAGALTGALLKQFANSFMLDARDSARVHQYEQSLDDEHVRFNHELRKFRLARPWLLQNPTNDVQRDYFHRKLYINGAKDLGDWGDQGDVVKCNTVYYGWRTSPDDSEQVFLIANMEGKPIERCPLKLFLNLAGEWQVAAHSPTLRGIPATVTRDFVLSDFRNGEVLLLRRSL